MRIAGSLPQNNRRVKNHGRPSYRLNRGRVMKRGRQQNEVVFILMLFMLLVVILLYFS
ncbi:hypothetical protein GCM10010912_62200 [Paenibacillus albidus]|uniref:Uncharacterized protein n=1 Tax=Paenibacillus albidus TaxID=2041023 RepID=A0A917FU75_9BACL|nr:hypothetical protein [Paenibacillus albidus]GGG09248.1 hypothetical protein GCM10010912_62200 [Paenibacillus albidus]